MKAPRRLLDDPTLASDVRLDLEHAAAASDPYDVARGEARLAAALGQGDASPSADAGSGAASAPQASSAVLSGPSLKLALSFASTGVIVTALLLSPWREAKAPVRTTTPRATLQSPLPAQPVAPLPEAAPALPKAAPAIESTKAEPAMRRSADADAELRRETAQLGRIKQLLEGQPARAYALAQSGHREFSRGMLREEREALAVLALWAMGKAEDARQRTEAFLARYPNSAARGQLEERLERAMRSDAKAP